MERYYSTQRPISIGTFPNPTNNRPVGFINFDSRKYCEEIGREAWGYLEYKNPLTKEEARKYELVKMPNEKQQERSTAKISEWEYIKQGNREIEM